MGHTGTRSLNTRANNFFGPIDHYLLPSCPNVVLWSSVFLVPIDTVVVLCVTFLCFPITNRIFQVNSLHTFLVIETKEVANVRQPGLGRGYQGRLWSLKFSDSKVIMSHVKKSAVRLFSLARSTRCVWKPLSSALLHQDKSAEALFSHLRTSDLKSEASFWSVWKMLLPRGATCFAFSSTFPSKRLLPCCRDASEAVTASAAVSASSSAFCVTVFIWEEALFFSLPFHFWGCHFLSLRLSSCWSKLARKRSASQSVASMRFSFPYLLVARPTEKVSCWK